MTKHVYAPSSRLDEVENKVYALAGAARGNGNMLDSASAQTLDVVKEAVNKPSDLLPERMARVIDKIEGDKNKAWAVSALLDGIARFEHNNGFTPSADLIDAVISQAENIADGSSTAVLPGGHTLDSVSTNNASATLSHQPNRIAVAITGGFSEAIPFGAYLPSDLKSNESKLGIITSIAGSDFGAYAAGTIMDGIGSGQSYTRAERLVPVTVSTDRLSATFSVTTQTAGGTAVPVQRNRTKVLIDGFPAADDQTTTSGTDTSLIAGQTLVGSATITVTGGVNVKTGVGTLTFAPALPAGAEIYAQAVIDFEAAPSLIPKINVIERSYSLYCSPSRVAMQITPDSRTQSQSELGADALTIAVQAARTQAANERYVVALSKAYGLAKRTKREYDFDYTLQIANKTRAQTWRDFGGFVSAVDQQVANNTMEFGLSFMYVGALGMSQFLLMEDFEAANVPARPGIYRIGRYKGKYDVYYSPYIVGETADSFEILCIGRSPQVARNPIVFSDAVPQTLIPLAVNMDLQQGAALFSRTLTEVNPHLQSAMGCALITVTNVYG